MRHEFKIISINISSRRGVHKKPVGCATLRKDHGLLEDGHAGKWHRQVSLLAQEEVDRVQKKHQHLSFDYHTENITTLGADLTILPVGTKLHIGDAVLEITQIGKEDQRDCDLEAHPREWVNIRKGVFARVRGGAEIDINSTCYYET